MLQMSDTWVLSDLEVSWSSAFDWMWLNSRASRSNTTYEARPNRQEYAQHHHRFDSNVRTESWRCVTRQERVFRSLDWKYRYDPKQAHECLPFVLSASTNSTGRCLSASHTFIIAQIKIIQRDIMFQSLECSSKMTRTSKWSSKTEITKVEMISLQGVTSIYESLLRKWPLHVDEIWSCS